MKTPAQVKYKGRVYQKVAGAPEQVKYKGQVYLKIAEAPSQVKYKGRIYVKADEVPGSAGNAEPVLEGKACETCGGACGADGTCVECSGGKTAKTEKRALGPKKFGKCPHCKGRMEIGDETPAERMCDKCAAKGAKPKKASVPEQVKYKGRMYDRVVPRRSVQAAPVKITHGPKSNTSKLPKSQRPGRNKCKCGKYTLSKDENGKVRCVYMKSNPGSREKIRHCLKTCGKPSGKLK